MLKQQVFFTEDRFVPTQVARSSVKKGECFGGAQPLMIAAGGSHTVVVMKDSSPWVWGNGRCGQLGQVDEITFMHRRNCQHRLFREPRLSLHIADSGTPYSSQAKKCGLVVTMEVMSLATR